MPAIAELTQEGADRSTWVSSGNGRSLGDLRPGLLYLHPAELFGIVIPQRHGFHVPKMERDF